MINQVQTRIGGETNIIITAQDSSNPIAGLALGYGLKVVGDGAANNLANGGIGFAKGVVPGPNTDFRAILLADDLDSLTTQDFGYFFSSDFGGGQFFNIGLSQGGGINYGTLGFDVNGNTQLSADASISLSSNSGNVNISSGTGTANIVGNDGAASGVSLVNIGGGPVAELQSGGNVSQLFVGTGTPEGVVTADASALFFRKDTLPALYLKTTNAVNTGWLEVQTSSSSGGAPYSTGPDISQAFGVTTYMHPGGDSNSAAETDVQMAVPASNFDYIKLRVATNTLDASTLVRLHVNGVATGPSVTIPAGSTGNFTDLTSIAVVDNDLISIEVNTGASVVGSIDIQSLLTGATVTATTPTTSKSAYATNGTLLSTAFGNTTFASLNAGGLSTSETPAGIPAFSGTGEVMKVLVETNTLDAATDVTFRVAGVSSGLTISIPATGVGTFTSTLSIPVTTDQLINYQIDASTSTTGTIDIRFISLQYNIT